MLSFLSVHTGLSLWELKEDIESHYTQDGFQRMSCPVFVMWFTDNIYFPKECLRHIYPPFKKITGSVPTEGNMILT